MQVDYLIVGQGIGGTTFCEVVRQSGMKALVIDEPSLSNSSKVAGGLYNPITGRKMVKTWNADRLFSTLIPFYKSLESVLESKFFYEKPIYRPFYSNEERNEWMGKSAEAHYIPYIQEITNPGTFAHWLKDPFGGVLLRQSGYLDTKVYLEAYRGMLVKGGLLKEEPFEHSKLELGKDGVKYGEIKARKLIYTDGRLLTTNPYFEWLPLKPVKGELLWIKSKTRFDLIFNRGVFLIPLSDGICKVGATYHHQNLSEMPTSEAKMELTQRLAGLINFDYEIVDQKAGIRPATKDRKPFVGTHPKHPMIAILGGLGAKGVSLAPFYAKQLLNHLEQGEEIDVEVNIERFFSLL